MMGGHAEDTRPALRRPPGAKGSTRSRRDLPALNRSCPARQSRSSRSRAAISPARRPRRARSSRMARSRNSIGRGTAAGISNCSSCSEDRCGGKLACRARRMLGMARSSPLGAAPRQARKRRNERVADAGALRPWPVRCAASPRMNSLTCWTDSPAQPEPPTPKQAATKRRTIGRWRARVASAAPSASRR